MDREDQRIERFIFPDGTSVELLVFDVREAHRTGAGATAPSAPAPAPRRLTRGGCCAPPPPPPEDPDAHTCPRCRSRLVYPVDWDRCGPTTWTLLLRCPECETRREVTLGRASVERFNRELYAGAQAIAREADQMTRRNLEDETDRFVAALERGLILPMDF